MKYWKEHVGLRAGLMTALFLGGLALILGGWKMTGRLSGLVIMVVGVVVLLAALALYNKPFEDIKPKITRGDNP